MISAPLLSALSPDFSHGGTETQSWKDINQITEKIIGCSIEVHRTLGPGLLEATYEEALCIEFTDAGMKFQRQMPFPIMHKGRNLGQYRLDLLVDEQVIVEIKSVELDSVFEAQILTYLRVTGKRVGLLINFNSRLLRDGVKRFAL